MWYLNVKFVKNVKKNLKVGSLLAFTHLKQKKKPISFKFKKSVANQKWKQSVVAMSSNKMIHNNSK